MPEQLTFFGAPEAVPEAIREAAPPHPPDDLPTPAAVADPRQCGLFEGPLADIGALEAACEQLDVATARAVWRRAEQRFPEWARDQSWPLWLDDLAWLAADDGPDASPLVARAQALAQTGPSSGRLAGMPAGLHDRIARGALAHAAWRLVAAHGPAAHLPDGRPAGCLLLLAGRAEEAAVMLAAAAAALPYDGLVHACLGEALWRRGRRQPALAAYVQACLVAPEAVDEAEVTCAPLHDLLDRAAELELPGAATEWVPVLADLEGQVSLLELAVEPPAGGPPAREGARLLRTYRRRRRDGALSDSRFALFGRVIG
ncbi:MAG TPA: hypothetical protein VGQ83_03700 [Polyangia bacterium]|jgi:hypothetical protein